MIDAAHRPTEKPIPYAFELELFGEIIPEVGADFLLCVEGFLIFTMIAGVEISRHNTVPCRCPQKEGKAAGVLDSPDEAEAAVREDGLQPMGRRG